MEERQIAGHRSSFGRLLVTLSVSALLPFTQAVAQKTAAAPSSRGVTQKKSTWVVRPEWVAAHERFLSSDAMHGRGSATRDEQITATYVASEFMAYGLKTAPGMQGYIQSAEVVSPTLSGNATLTVGNVTLKEGDDFHLLIASGAPVTATLVKVLPENVAQAHARGAVVLVGGDPLKAMGPATQLLRAGRGCRAGTGESGDGRDVHANRRAYSRRRPAQGQPAASSCTKYRRAHAGCSRSACK